MPDISTRINALIAYLFLGPIILLARKNTPLAEPFVREHAKKSTLIIIVGVLAFILYRSLHTYIMFGIFGISFDSIILMSIVSLILLALTTGAYRAYHGVHASESSWKSLSMPEQTMEFGIYSEADKVHIIASFIPFIGIIILNQSPRHETRIGRKIGNFFTLIMLISIVFLSGTTSTLTLIITLIYIGLIVTTAVQLFGFSRFVEFSAYHRIPTYLEFDAHLKASIISIYDFCRITFGGSKKTDYQIQYMKFLSQNTQVQAPTIPYFAPSWLIAIPGINLITIPSLWQTQYREYTPLILQGLAITIGTILIVVFSGLGSQMGLFLLFPIISLIAESKTNIFTRAPFTSIMVDLYHLFSLSQAKIEKIKQEGEEKVEYKYEVDKK